MVATQRKGIGRSISILTVMLCMWISSVVVLFSLMMSYLIYGE